MAGYVTRAGAISRRYSVSPFIVWLPDRCQGAGKRGDVLSPWASLLDVYPTILELAGVHVDSAQIHGRSLLPLLLGEPARWRDDAFVEFHGLNHLATSMVTARHGNIKYGWNCSGTDELYDLAADPFEMTNQIATAGYQDQANDMRQLIETWMQKTHYPGLTMYRRSRLRIM